MLGANLVPTIEAIGPPAPDKGLVLLDARNDGVVMQVTVSYNQTTSPVRYPYSVSMVSPIRTGPFEHELFIGKKAVLAPATWRIRLPGLYPTAEVRVSVAGPVEVVAQRLVISDFRRAAVDTGTQSGYEIYVKESNIPKLFPSELERLFPAKLPVWGVKLLYPTWRDFHGARVYNFSVVNGLPAPNISYALETQCANLRVLTADRQFWFSRDEILMIAPADCRPITVKLRLFTLIQTGLVLLGFERAGEYGVETDTLTFT